MRNVVSNHCYMLIDEVKTTPNLATLPGGHFSEDFLFATEIMSLTMGKDFQRRFQTKTF